MKKSIVLLALCIGLSSCSAASQRAFVDSMNSYNQRQSTARKQREMIRYQAQQQALYNSIYNPAPKQVNCTKIGNIVSCY